MWLPLAPLVPAAAWAGLHYSAWHSYVFGTGASTGIGSIEANTGLASSLGSYPVAEIVHVANYILAVGLVLVGLGALYGLVRYHSRWHVLIGLCALSATPIFAGTQYGGEADNRVIFFAVPWLAILCADAVSGLRTVIPRDALLFVWAGTNFVAITGLDYSYVPPSSALTAERYAETVAPAGAAVVAAGVANTTPGSVTGRYPDLKFRSRFSLGGYTGLGSVSEARYVDNWTHNLPGYVPATAYFVVGNPTVGRYDEQKGVAPAGEYSMFAYAMNSSPAWKVVFDRGGSEIWKMVAVPRS
jgi:hypothetical protein